MDQFQVFRVTIARSLWRLADLFDALAAKAMPFPIATWEAPLWREKFHTERNGND